MKAIKKLLRCKMLLSILLCFGPICGISAEQDHTSQNNFNSLSSEEKTVLNQIVSYLSQHSLSPFIRGGEFEYTHLNFMKDSYNNNTHALGILTQGDASCYALFSINKKWFWSEFKTDLVYISTDHPISPVLFADIAQLAASLLPKDPANFHVFIEKKEDPDLPNEFKLQKWTFFNQQESTELLVVLTEDDQGGMYFNIYKTTQLLDFSGPR